MDLELRTEPDFQPEFQFDENVESFWMNSMNQDLNNNLNEPAIDPAIAEPKDGEDFSFDDLSRGEYSYQAFTNIPNFWAGPSYWKHPRNIHRGTQNNENPAQPKSRRRRIERAKAIFTETNNEDADTSENEGFLKATARALKKIRHCNYRLWAPEKLKLPPQYDIPKTIFDSYTFCPSIDICHPHETEEITQANIDDDNEFPVSSAQRFNLHFVSQ